MADRLLRVDHRLTAASTSRTSRLRGVRRVHLIGWLFVAPALFMYTAFVLLPLALTFQYSFYRWDGIGPSEWVGLGNYVNVLTDPDLVGVILNAFKLILFFSFIPVGLGLDRRGRHAPDRDRSIRDRVANGPVPSADHPAGRRRHSVEMGAVLVRPREPDPVRDRARRRHTSMAGGLRHRPAGRRVHRCVGPDRPVHDPAADRHEQDRPRPLRVGPARWGGAIQEFRSITLPSLRQEIGVCITVTVIAALASFDIVYIATGGGPGGSTAVPGWRSTNSPSRAAGRLGVCAGGGPVHPRPRCVLPIQRLARGDE